MSLGGHQHGGDGDAYVRAALDRECGMLANTAHGRNDQANRSAFAIGQFVGAGLLGRQDAEHHLFTAAEMSGIVGKDGATAVRATIKSGLDKGEREPREIPDSVRLNGAHRPSAIVIQHPASAPVSKPQPVLSGVPLPDWTEPDPKGKPTFFGIDVVDPKPLAGELRRHTYRRDGAPVRVKVKLQDDGFRDFYRVRRPADGATGWQARKPESYVPMPYLGPADAFDPFDPEHLGETLFWPEGEKDVDSLQRAGMVAFTFGGTSDLPPCEDLLRGRDLVILGDNDDSGEKCVARKIEMARPVAGRVRVGRFPELGAGHDVSDWLAAGNSPDSLMARLQEPPEPLPQPFETVLDGSAGRGPKLRKIEARARQGEDILDEMFKTVDQGVSTLESHRAEVESAFANITSTVKNIAEAATAAVTSNLAGMKSGVASDVSGAANMALASAKGAGLDIGAITSALASATNLATTLVGPTVEAHVGALGDGIEAATSQAIKAAGAAGATGSLVANLAAAVAKTISVIQNLGAPAEQVAPAVVAHAEASDAPGHDQVAAASEAAQSAGADHAVASSIAAAVAAAA